MLIIIELEPLGYWLDCQIYKGCCTFYQKKERKKENERKKLYRQNLYYLYRQLCYYHIAHKTLTCTLNIKLLFDRVFFAIICHYPFTLLQDVIKSNLNLKIGRNNSTDSADIVIVMMSHYTRVWTHSLYVFSSSVDLVSKGPRATTSLVFPFAVDSNPPASIRWLYNNLPLIETRYAYTELIRDAADGSRQHGCLFLNKPTHLNNGNYTLIVENKLGRDQATRYGKFMDNPFDPLDPEGIIPGECTVHHHKNMACVSTAVWCIE